MVTMDSAARAIDALLHRGRAEERDGGVWIDDLGAEELSSDGAVFDEYGQTWKDAAGEWEKEYDDMEKERDWAEERCEKRENLLREIVGELDSLEDAAELLELEDVIRNVLALLEPIRPIL